MVTRDETHSTRGRANALRAAMMGLLGPESMAARELYDVLDLCLSCHACYSECPSSVDMTKLKAEFLHSYYREHGIPLRSRVFAHIGSLNALGQTFSPLANWLLNGPGKPVFTGLGIHPQRSFPKITPTRFTTWFKRTPRLRSDHKVVFFYDTFIEFNSPHIGVAAVRVLEAAGIQVILPPGKVDSGRPAVSKGLLPLAKRLAEKNVAILAPYARQGLPIVGCEPSSMVMLVNEYRDLVPSEDSIVVAQQSMMLDRYLADKAKSGEVELELDDTPRQVLFHGHCQQKAFFGTESVHRMLKLIPNCAVEPVESSCCGMAGSFGYETEHYDLSIQLAERSLAPAIRAAAPGTIISAMGTSCRDQIDHTTSRQAVHPIEILASALRRPQE
jgi:Fe-S oxidoreductase